MVDHHSPFLNQFYEVSGKDSLTVTDPPGPPDNRKKGLEKLFESFSNHTNRRYCHFSL